MSGKQKKRNKNGLLTLDSTYDFSKAFEEKKVELEHNDDSQSSSGTEKQNLNKPILNKHGMKVLDKKTVCPAQSCETKENDFETLLEQSFISKTSLSPAKPKPMPIKKRIKRYPPVQKELDLHGCTAIKAQVRARTFIQNHKQQGFFTLRLIVGKGRHSKMGPVLPDVIEDLVVAMKKQGVVLWFEWDKKSKSRSGALIVYLKQFDAFD